MEIRKDFQKSKEDVEKFIDSIPIEAVKEVIPEDPSMVDSKYFNGGLQPVVEAYIPKGLELTPEEMISLKNGIKNVTTGLRCAIPLTCYGPSCPFKVNCPFFKIGKLPVGKVCPIENISMDLLTKRYIDEFEVVSSSISEVTTMQMLAATHIMEERAWKTLASSEDGKPDGLIKNVVGFNNDDQPIIQLQEHPAFNQIERAWRWRKNLLESLVGTRKEKYKRDSTMKQKKGEDSPAAFLADLKSKIDKKNHLNLRGEK